MNKLLLLISFIFCVSCSEYTKLLKSQDYDKKYVKAIEYYNDGECYKALPLFEELLGIKKGTDVADDVYYYVAKTNYCLKQNFIANYYFKTFTKNYPNSEYVEECQFLAAMCSYRNSPKYSLDQKQSKLAIEEFQLFINRYPESTLKDSCNNMIAELSGKIEYKDYENAVIFHKTEKYKAATISLGNFLSKYPYSEHKEEMMFKIVESHYKLAENSVEKKKLDRFKDCIESYYNFVSAFPNSSDLDTAENYYSKSKKYIDESQ